MLQCIPASFLQDSGQSPSFRAQVYSKVCAMWVQARLTCSRTRAWEEISLPADMGMDCGHYKWYQNQSFVELALPLPDHAQPKEVSTYAVAVHEST